MLDPIELEINKIRESGTLGVRGRLLDLFEYLAKTHRAETTPKENELALQVFNKNLHTESDDASVRVYVHRLRKRLESYYLHNPTLSGVVLCIPQGEYRLVLQAPPEKSPAKIQPSHAFKKWLGIMLLTLLVGNFLIWKVFLDAQSTQWQIPDLNPIWRELNTAKRPVMIVVGDYYLYSEVNAFGESVRLVRDYKINSSLDLEKIKKPPEHTAGIGTGISVEDIGLQYLPVAVACGLKNILPLMKQTGRSMKLIQASKATPSILKENDVIYFGLFSGLGFLEGLVFSNSLYELGPSYDQISIRESGKIYESGEPLGLVTGDVYSDYGYFSFHKTAEKHTVIIVAGTRDTGLCGAAEAISQPRLPEKIAAAFHGGLLQFEVLFDVRGQHQINFRETVISLTTVD